MPDQPTISFTVWGSGLGVEYPGCEEGARSAWFRVRDSGSGSKITDLSLDWLLHKGGTGQALFAALAGTTRGQDTQARPFEFDDFSLPVRQTQRRSAPSEGLLENFGLLRLLGLKKY